MSLAAALPSLRQATGTFTAAPVSLLGHFTAEGFAHFTQPVSHWGLSGWLVFIGGMYLTTNNPCAQGNGKIWLGASHTPALEWKMLWLRLSHMSCEGGGHGLRKTGCRHQEEVEQKGERQKAATSHHPNCDCRVKGKAVSKTEREVGAAVHLKPRPAVTKSSVGTSLPESCQSSKSSLSKSACHLTLSMLPIWKKRRGRQGVVWFFSETMFAGFWLLASLLWV